jgi:phage FluMu protein Com
MVHQIDFMNKCIFCGNVVEPFSRAPEFSNSEYVNIKCPRCNQYSLHSSAKRYFDKIITLDETQKLIISNEVYNNI